MHTILKSAKKDVTIGIDKPFRDDRRKNQPDRQ